MNGSWQEVTAVENSYGNYGQSSPQLLQNRTVQSTLHYRLRNAKKSRRPRHCQKPQLIPRNRTYEHLKTTQASNHLTSPSKLLQARQSPSQEPATSLPKRSCWFYEVCLVKIGQLSKNATLKSDKCQQMIQNPSKKNIVDNWLNNSLEHSLRRWRGGKNPNFNISTSLQPFSKSPAVIC